MRRTSLITSAVVSCNLAVASPTFGQEQNPAATYENAIGCYITYSGLYGVATIELSAGTGRMTAQDQAKFVSAANRLDPIILRLGTQLGKSQQQMLADLQAKHAAESPEPKKLLEQGRFEQAMEILLSRARACDSIAFN